jgi:hypothetical protein
MRQEIKTVYCVGKVSYEKSREFTKIANNLSLFNSNKWRIPSWDEARKLVSRFLELQTIEGDFFWTDNKSSTRKINLKDGSFFECNQKHHLEDKELLFLVNDNEIEIDLNIIFEVDHLKFMKVPFSSMTYGMVDVTNDILSDFNFLGYSSFERPTIEDLKLIFDEPISPLVEGEYWSNSIGGKFNAFQLNFLSGEAYSCKKMSDYNDRLGFSIAIIE